MQAASNANNKKAFFFFLVWFILFQIRKQEFIAPFSRIMKLNEFMYEKAYTG